MIWALSSPITQAGTASSTAQLRDSAPATLATTTRFYMTHGVDIVVALAMTDVERFVAAFPLEELS